MTHGDESLGTKKLLQKGAVAARSAVHMPPGAELLRTLLQACQEEGREGEGHSRDPSLLLGVGSGTPMAIL